MTPEEKARQLMDQFYHAIDHDGGVLKKKVSVNKAKQCALICVDEILELIEKNDIDMWDYMLKRYWQQVKQSLIKQ